MHCVSVHPTNSRKVNVVLFDSFRVNKNEYKMSTTEMQYSLNSEFSTMMFQMFRNCVFYGNIGNAICFSSF